MQERGIKSNVSLTQSDSPTICTREKAGWLWSLWTETIPGPRIREVQMKRIVVLIDGTWEQEGVGNDTNVAKLDSPYKVAGSSLIEPVDKNGVTQLVEYHKGVGAGVADPVKHWLS